jgi:ABC-type dipeptide/oligopeptide/nickel transport system permease component
VPLVAGFAVAAGVIYVLLSLAVDLGVAAIDPRLGAV